MQTAITPEQIAADINANCDALDAGLVTREQWHNEQHRLWKLAADNVIASKVLRLVASSVNSRTAEWR